MIYYPKKQPLMIFSVATEHDQNLTHVIFKKFVSTTPKAGHISPQDKTVLYNSHAKRKRPWAACNRKEAEP